MKDTIKKILIRGGISIAIISIMILVVIIIRSEFSNTEEVSKIETKELIQDENVIITDIKKEQQEDIKKESDKVEENVTQEQIIKEEPKKQKEKEVKQIQVEEKEKKNVNTKSQNNKVNEIPSNNTNSVEINTNNSNDKSEVQTDKNNNSSSQTNSTTSNKDKKVETFKYNSKMTQKMITTIKSNESEYMKQYGYTVVIDESIIANTNQFTYTDNRVKNALTYKFGTIKVYARDYFVNGQYMWTECFII